jgi:heme o synthase
MVEQQPNESQLRKITMNFEFKHYSLITSISIFMAIVLGITLSAMDGSGCPDWPTCYGEWLPPAGGTAFWDYIHRAVTGISFLLVFSVLLVSLKVKGSNRIIKASFLGAFVFMATNVILGALPTLNTSAWMSTMHLFLALFAFAASIIGTTAVFSRGTYDYYNPSLKWNTGYKRLVLLTVIIVLVLLVSGSAVTMSAGTSSCAGWPLCNGQIRPQNSSEWINTIHRLLVLVSGGFVLGLFLQTWRKQRSQVGMLVAATITMVLFFSQGLMGAVNAAYGYPGHLIGLHAATSVAIFGSLSVLLTLSGLSSRTNQDELQEINFVAGRRTASLFKDYLMLTKPIVVALLLVTTLAGMVIGAKSWPELSVIFWTMLGGFLAAGGSGAINQYIDREDDLLMQRTAKRPLPSGRLMPAEGLAFGVGISLVSFFVMVAFVNFLAALLTLAGIIYYVVLYSLLLKKTTVQNIVIGGGAGALPPLVGWAAATGTLTFPALLLFAVVFMWTPPHFWALAIVRRKDYERAGVPMLPVVRGQDETRWQVFIYTIELVLLTLILPVFGLGSAIYLVSALFLGGFLLHSAYQVWKTEGNKIAWKMYRYSSMYLAFLFLALMIDRLIL